MKKCTSVPGDLSRIVRLDRNGTQLPPKEWGNVAKLISSAMGNRGPEVKHWTAERQGKSSNTVEGKFFQEYSYVNCYSISRTFQACNVPFEKVPRMR